MDSEFRVPYPRKRAREHVLDEDAYLEKLYQIIERDYFPDKKKLKALNDLLEAEDTHDQRVIDKMTRRLIQINAGESGCSTPDTLADSELNQDRKETLDAFLKKFTTEDNKSFEKIQEQNRQKLKLKYWWAFNDQNRSIEGPTALLAIEQGSNTHLNVSPYTALSNFYYHPENYQNTLATLAEFEDFRGPPKEIKAQNTRFDAEFLMSQEDLVHNQPTPVLNMRGELKTPDISDPSQIPITWGELESTPLILHEDKRFKIPQPSDKEQLGRNLADRVLTKPFQSSCNMKSPKTPIGSIFGQSPRLSRPSSTIFPVLRTPSKRSRLT